jgi:hypothetical protein
MSVLLPAVTLRRTSRLSAATLQLAVATLVYAVLRVLTFHGVIGTTPTVYPDTVDYQHVASLSLLDSGFWTYWKPWGLPLFWKALPGATARSAPFAQWLISGACWLVLAVAVSRCLRHKGVRLAAFCLVLAFSLTPLVAQWDGVLLSESLSASLTALLVAALLMFVRSPQPRTGAAVLAIVALASATRDTNAYLALFLVCPIGLAVALHGARRLGLAVTAGVVVVFVLSLWTYNVHRWETPMQGVIAVRILSDADARDFFAAHGMPIRPGLAAALLANRVPPSRFDQAPELAYFRPWFKRHARSTYVRYLASHPGAAIAEPLEGFDQVITPARSLPQGLDFFRPQGFHTVLPAPILAVLYTQHTLPITFAMLVALLTALGLVRRRVNARPTLVALAGLIVTVPLAIVIWNGDQLGLDGDRHSLVVGLVARVSVLLAFLLALDAAFTHDALRRLRS